MTNASDFHELRASSGPAGRELSGWQAAVIQARCRAMKVADIKRVAERQPFRPFGVRVNNGEQYTFSEARNFGAPKDYHVVVFFGESELVLIDTDSITEIIER
jgi:hypothetical protein